MSYFLLLKFKLLQKKNFYKFGNPSINAPESYTQG